MIPKIIHQIWIGPNPAPTKFMDTWKDKNPDFKYIIWNEEELKKKQHIFCCKHRVNEIEEICGQVDIIRWEILYEYGGIFIDADSICIEPIDDILMNTNCFSTWEQEKIRPGLIAIGTMGFPPKHPLLEKIIEWIKNNPVSFRETKKRAWLTVGPTLLTTFYNNNNEFKKEITIFPSYTFLPIHCSGLEYNGHGKIYAHQEWGSTKKSYSDMNNLSLPPQFLPPPPENSISVLLSSYNTKEIYIKECLDSIKYQQGYFNIELVWINDGSSELNTKLLKELLSQFEKTTRFIKVVYNENECNKGLGYSLNKGVKLCNNELIMRMDSDDIMFSNRLQKQIEFMNINKDCVLSGSQIEMFKFFNGIRQNMGKTTHPNLDLQTFKKNTTQHWLMNHPTFCFRKTEILSIGNYNDKIHSMCEDFELILRVLKKYGKIMNIQEPLLYYRLHEEQLTYNGGKQGGLYWNNIRNDLIKTLI